MKKKKLYSMFLVLPCFFVWSSICGAEMSSGSGGGNSGIDIQSPKEAVKGEAEETLNSARNALDEASRVTYENMVPKTEEIQKDAKSCLDGIMNTDFSGSFGFDLDLPSINDMLGKACNKIDSNIQDYIDDVSKKFKPSFYNDLIKSEMGVGMGGASTPNNTIDYDRQGEEIADDLWHEIEREKPWLER